METACCGDPFFDAQTTQEAWVGGDSRISLFLEEEKACLVHLETANGAFPFPVPLLILSF